MADDDDAASKRRQQRRTGMDSMSALPEHLQHEVFSRVGDVKALFRFAATCRGWHRRFTDPAFLLELCPNRGSGHRARLLGVILQDRWFNPCNKAMVQARMMTMATPPQRASSPSSSASMAPVFLPALGSPLGPQGRAVTSFVVGGDDDGTFDYAEPLAARCGIVLVRLAPRTPEEMDYCLPLFGVCNLITGDRHVLPPLECTGRRLDGYAIITAAVDDDSRSGDGRPDAAAARFTFSQLLVITQDDGERPRGKAAEGYLQHWYSAATRRWSAPTGCLDCRVFTLVGTTATAMPGVVHRGAAHWLCVGNGRSIYERAARGDGDDDRRLYRVSVEVATARVSLTRLPVRVGGKQHLCVNSDGELAVASVYPFYVTFWTQPGRAGDDDDTTPATAAAESWPRTSFRIASQQSPHERWCNFNHGSLFAIFRGSGVCILDLHTKVTEEAFMLDFDNKARFLAPSGATNCVTCVPYEIDLVDFFTLQLGGMRQRLSGTTSSETMIDN